MHKDLESQPLAGYKRLAGASVSADAWEASPMVVGTQVAMSGIDILIFRTYHRGGIDVQVLSDVSKATANGRVPFIMYGDFNAEPDELRALEWLSSVDAVIAGPFVGTCRSSGAAADGRNIDFLVISNCIAPLVVSAEAVWSVPFAPHCAIKLTLRREPRLVKETIPVKPRAFEDGFLPWIQSLDHAALAHQWSQAQTSAENLAQYFPPLPQNGNLSAGVALQRWCMSLELLALPLEEKPRSPQALAALLGRGQRVQYKTAHGIRSRRAPKCGVHTTVPAGYNAPARVAATFASLARHLVSSPGAPVFRLALLALLDADKDPIVAAFWQELDVEVGDKLRVAVGRAVIADQAESSAWLRRTLASLSEGIERRLTRASLQAGSSDWKKWALASLEKGAAQAHKFCRTQEHVPSRASSTGSLSRSQLAADASLHWEGIWRVHDTDRAERVVKAIAELREKVLLSGEAQKTAQAITLTDLRAAAASFPRRTSIGPDHIEFFIISSLPDLVLAPMLDIVRSMVCSLSWAPQVLHNWIALLAKKQGGHRCIAIMASTVRLVMRLLCRP